jgi:hypothetical protein
LATRLQLRSRMAVIGHLFEHVLAAILARVQASLALPSAFRADWAKSSEENASVLNCMSLEPS